GAGIEWPGAACGAEENADARMPSADGTIGHAEISLGDGATVFVSTPPDYESPLRHRELCGVERRMHDNPWVIDGHFVEVEDVDAHHARAAAHGAAILREPEDQPYGFRVYTAEDLEGHRWMFGQRT